MFGIGKLKQRIEQLENDARALRVSISRIDWERKNPPKYKEGQVTKFGKCTAVKLIRIPYGFCCEYYRYEYHFGDIIVK